ncbi:MAG: dienelactone hydrolase family protein [Pedococcus sp.]
MVEVVVYHHVQGLTTGVVAFADELRQAGHTVHTPDLFDGRTFATIEDGMAYARQTGFEALLERGTAAAESLPSDGLVYAGFSMGVMPAQKLAQTRAGAAGALLLHACVPVSEFGQRWPDGVPVQVHGMDADPFFTEEGGDLDAAQELAASTDQAEVFLYPGNEHLFTDSSLASYDSVATALLLKRALRFLDGVGPASAPSAPL